MPPRHLDSGKTGCGHFRNDRVGRPEIGEIAGLRLREIGVIQPVVGLLRTHIVEREPAATPQHAKGLAQHARLVEHKTAYHAESFVEQIDNFLLGDIEPLHYQFKMFGEHMSAIRRPFVFF